jgi:hypothetical protein
VLGEGSGKTGGRTIGGGWRRVWDCGDFEFMGTLGVSERTWRERDFDVLGDLDCFHCELES